MEFSDTFKDYLSRVICIHSVVTLMTQCNVSFHLRKIWFLLCFMIPPHTNPGLSLIIFISYTGLLSHPVSFVFSWPIILHLSYFSPNTFHPYLTLFILDVIYPVLHECRDKTNMQMVPVFQKLSLNLISLMVRNICHIIN